MSGEEQRKLAAISGPLAESVPLTPALLRLDPMFRCGMIRASRNSARKSTTEGSNQSTRGSSLDLISPQQFEFRSESGLPMS
jgi:hypothetical protein